MQNALAVGMYAARELDVFIEKDDGSLDEGTRTEAQRIRIVHDACSDAFEALDKEMVDPYTQAPALPSLNAAVKFVSARYFALVQEHDEAQMAIADYICKEDSDADSDEERVIVKSASLE